MSFPKPQYRFQQRLHGFIVATTKKHPNKYYLSLNKQKSIYLRHAPMQSELSLNMHQQSGQKFTAILSVLRYVRHEHEWFRTVAHATH